MDLKFKEALSYFKLGDLNNTKIICLSLLKEDSKNSKVYNLYAFALYLDNNIDESISAWKKAIEINKNYFEAYNGLGNAYLKKKDYEYAIECFNKSIEIEPRFYEGLNNLGNTYVQKKIFEKAEIFFDKALEIKPGYSKSLKGKGYTLMKIHKYKEAIKIFEIFLLKNKNDPEIYNYLGICFNHLKIFDKSIEFYLKCLEIKKNHKEAKENLLNILTYFTPNVINHSNVIIEANYLLKKLHFNFDLNLSIKDEDIFNFFSRINEVLNKYSFLDNSGDDQIFRRNKINLNCDRHFAVFNKHDVIPEYCFGCFKIQVTPKNIIELIKLYLIFDLFIFEKNNIRKTFVEIRPKIGGTYKGLIYCNSLIEAENILKKISPTIKKVLNDKVSVKIKRGCTEFSNRYKNFEKTDNSVKYEDAWREKEKLIDIELKHEDEAILENSLSGLNIKDALTIRNWLIFAKKIGDSSFLKFNQTLDDSNLVNNWLKNQLELRISEFKKIN